MEVGTIARAIKVKLSPRSLDEALEAIREYERSIARKKAELCRRLAEMGAVKVSLGYARAAYSGNKDISIDVEKTPRGYAIVASGESVAFVEFGAGARYGYGHPQAAEFGVGPGTWPDPHYRKDKSGNLVANWENPQGWWIPSSKGGGHTYGNPPSAVMYNTAKDLRAEVARIAREVFAAD